MYDLINKKVTFTRGIKVDQHVSRLVGIHAQGVKKQINYYQENYTQVSGRNPFIRLAYTLMAAQIEEPLKLYHHARTIINDLVSPVGFTNDVHFGEVSSEFFGGVPTIILASDKTNPADMIISTTGYEKQRSLRVLHVPTAQDNLMRPDLAEHAYGYGVLEIDIPLFAFSLAQWRKKNKTLPIDKQETVEMFIGKYVLPNAMYSQADAYIMALCDSETDDNVTSAVKTFVTDVGKELWQKLKDFRGKFNKASTIEDNLKGLPAVFMENQFDVVRFPTDYVTIQEYWAVMAHFLRPIKIGLEIAEDNQDAKRIRNLWKREMKRIELDGTLRKIPDDTLTIEMEIAMINIDTIIENYR